MAFDNEHALSGLEPSFALGIGYYKAVCLGGFRRGTDFSSESSGKSLATKFSSFVNRSCRLEPLDRAQLQVHEWCQTSGGSGI